MGELFFFIWDNLNLPEINIFKVVQPSELQNPQVGADILLANDNMERWNQGEKLTTQTPYKAFHLSCMSPTVQQCEDASACDKYWPLSSDLWKVKR